MEKLFLFVLCFFSNLLFSQVIEITNQNLINYHVLINKAEICIVEKKLDSAKVYYSKAFALTDKPHSKDIYNEMIALLKINDFKNAFNNYKTLKCLEFNFDEGFIEKKIPLKFKNKRVSCNFKLDYQYKKQLDSLFNLDQYYRNLSKGDYAKYKKELTKTDSITATSLYKLINEKGFPDEYEIGLSMANKSFFQNFYFIILHQLSTNLYSSQKVNFTSLLNKALNEGKIEPDAAAFLIDINNGESHFFSKHFSINQFLTSNGSSVPIYEQVRNKTAKTDCCYVTYGFFPEKRTDFINKLLSQLNENRKKIGLSSIDDLIKKSVFSLDNKDYIFDLFTIENHQAENEDDIKFLKDQMFKIK